MINGETKGGLVPRPNKPLPLISLEMKKLLLTFVIILLFVGVGFVYLLKNPTSAISQKILPLFGIAYIETVDVPWTIDLTDCISYFDGCNNCTVENGKPSACTLMYCETPGEPKCNEYASDNIGIANPASTNCVNKGGKLEIVDTTWWQVGMCTLSDGKVCEERAYMEGECGKNDILIINNFESCAQAGNPIMESYPRQCAHNGKSYTEVIEEGTACTMDAKACPDGSYVGRVAPNCEFAPCPGN